MNVFHFYLSIFLYYNVLILNLQGIIYSKMNIENEVTSKIAPLGMRCYLSIKYFVFIQDILYEQYLLVLDQPLIVALPCIQKILLQLVGKGHMRERLHLAVPNAWFLF